MHSDRDDDDGDEDDEDNGYNDDNDDNNDDNDDDDSSDVEKPPWQASAPPFIPFLPGKHHLGEISNPSSRSSPTLYPSSS